MAVKLRLKRMGKKKQPIYKVVAADSRSPRDGKFIEAIGLYNPKTEPATVEIKEDRALYWLSVGAQPTDTVKNLLSEKGIILRRELIKKGLTEEQIAARMDEWKKMKEAIKKAEKSKSKQQQSAEKIDDKSESSENSYSAAEVKGTASGEA